MLALPRTHFSENKIDPTPIRGGAISPQFFFFFAFGFAVEGWDKKAGLDSSQNPPNRSRILNKKKEASRFPISSGRKMVKISCE